MVVTNMRCAPIANCQLPIAYCPHVQPPEHSDHRPPPLLASSSSAPPLFAALTIIDKRRKCFPSGFLLSKRGNCWMNKAQEGLREVFAQNMQSLSQISFAEISLNLNEGKPSFKSTFKMLTRNSFQQFVSPYFPDQPLSNLFCAVRFEFK